MRTIEYHRETAAAALHPQGSAPHLCVQLVRVATGSLHAGSAMLTALRPGDVTIGSFDRDVSPFERARTSLTPGSRTGRLSAPPSSEQTERCPSPRSFQLESLGHHLCDHLEFLSHSVEIAFGNGGTGPAPSTPPTR